MPKPNDNMDDAKILLDSSIKKEIKQPREQDLDKSYVVKKATEDSPIGVPKMVKVTEERWGELEKQIEMMLKSCFEDRQGFIDKLEEYEETIQGIPESGRQGPWDGSCDLRDTLTGTHCRTIETAINRTLGVDPPFLATVKGDKELEKRLTGLANTSAKHDFDFEKTLTFISKAAVRRTAAIIIPEWERKVKVSKDIEYYKTVDAYKDIYPDAKSAGLTESEYQREIEIVSQDIKEKGYHECLYEYDEVVINRPTVTVVGPEKFVMFPYLSSSVDLAKLLGHEMDKTYQDLKMMERDGIYKNVDRIAYLSSVQATEDKDDAPQMKRENKGIESANEIFTYRDKIYKVYKGIVRLDVYKDGLERDYEYAYIYEQDSNCKVLLRLAPYTVHFGERNYIVGNILPEEDTIFGTCIPELTENPQATLDILIRQLIDSNSIANIPVFKAHWNDRTYLEDSRQKGKFYPGRIMYSKHPDALDAFRSDRIDASAYLHIMRYIGEQTEMTTGASRTLAGQVPAQDPEAPGVKTAMLIQQSNFMVNEYIKNLRPALSKMITFIAKLYRQHMKVDEIKEIVTYNEDGAKEVKPVNRDDIKFLESLTTFEIKNQRVEDSRQSRLMSARADMELLLAIPQINQNPIAVRALVYNYLITNERYSLDEIEKILPTQEQIQAMFRNVAQDVLAQERAQQQMSQNEQQFEQTVENQEQNLDRDIREA